jgi:4'-phosphopantetheinyl transferase
LNGPQVLKTAMVIPLLEDEIHVWWAGSSVSDDEHAWLRRSLTADDHHRAARYRLDLLRRRFVTGRGILRVLLGAYLEVSPEAVRLQYGSFGKPALDRCHRSDITFSLAHSQEVIVYAVGRGAELGIDLEHLRPLNHAAIVDRFFSTRECSAFHALPDSQKLMAFLLGWTRKEAYLKGRGAGLSECLGDVEVTLAPGEPARILATKDAAETGNWRLETVAAADGWLCTLAEMGGPRRLTTKHWNQSSLRGDSR